MSIKNILEKIDFNKLGLNKTEWLIYTALLRKGPLSGKEIIKNTHLHRSTVYDYVDKLIEKGLVKYFTKEGKKLFHASSPDHFLEIINEEKRRLSEREKYVRKVVKDLSSIRSETNNLSPVEVYEGRNGMKVVIKDILESKYVYSFASRGRLKSVLGYHFSQFQIQKKIKGIKDKILISEEFKDSEYIKEIVGEVRFIPSKYEYPVATILHKGEKIAIFILRDSPLAIVIKDKDVYRSFKAYFDLLWSMAKP